jgi:hypothetical protein
VVCQWDSPKLVVSSASLLATFTAISPDIPLLVLVKTTLLAQRSDILGHTAFVITGVAHISTNLQVKESRKCLNLPIVPLSQILRHLVALCLARKQLVGLDSPFPGRKEDVDDLGGINESALAVHKLSSASDLVLAGARQRDVSRAGVTAVLAPFGLAVADQEHLGSCSVCGCHFCCIVFEAIYVFRS